MRPGRSPPRRPKPSSNRWISPGPNPRSPPWRRLLYRHKPTAGPARPSIFASRFKDLAGAAADLPAKPVFPVLLQLNRGLCDSGQRLHEACALVRGQRIEQRAFGAIRCGARTAQSLASGLRDRNGIRACIFFGAFAADQFLLEHPAHHLGKRRTIDTRHLDECGLTHALIVFESGEHRELLLGEFVPAGFARIEIAIVLLTTLDEMRRRFCQFEPPVRPARTL